MKSKVILIAFISLFVDQIVKYLVSLKLIRYTIIPDFLSLVYAKNTGVAFSMLSGDRIFIIVISVVLLIILYNFAIKEQKKGKLKKYDYLAYGLLFGGIIGNLIDRVIRGYVIDYVSLKIFGYNFPIFNLADLAITIGILLLIILELKKNEKTPR